MKSTIQVLDTVALREDFPELGLSVGEVGVVVELYSTKAADVEFVDRTGQTYGLHTLPLSQLMPLHQRGLAFRLQSEVA